jgi:hypothetical protein
LLAKIRQTEFRITDEIERQALKEPVNNKPAANKSGFVKVGQISHI